MLKGEYLDPIRYAYIVFFFIDSLGNFSSCNRNPRFYTGLVSAIVGGAFTFALLSPLFDYIEMSLGTVALYILTSGATAVSMCAGILLPRPLAGTTFGAVVTVIVGIFLSPVSYFPFVTMGVSAFFTLLSIRCVIESCKLLITYIYLLHGTE